MFVHIAMRLLFFQQPETDKNGFLAANGGMEFNVKNQFCRVKIQVISRLNFLKI